jgi:septum formation protein
MQVTAASCPPLFTLAPNIQLVLASASPRRQQFLQRWGIPFLLCPSPVEPQPSQGEHPHEYTCRAAHAKALAAAQILGKMNPAPDPAHTVILAADTVVALDNAILGKPRNREDALRMLQALSGRAHDVISSVCLLFPPILAQPARQEQRQKIFSQKSRVFFHDWPRQLLQAYVAGGEPADKAGAYAIQEQGAVLVERVEGCWSTVAGLPLTRLAEELMRENIMKPAGAVQD